MGQHTQGPWFINADPSFPSEPCVDAIIDGVIWHVALCHNAAGPEEDCAEANARLIAAAPELLATLRQALPALRADLERQLARSAQTPTVESVALRAAKSRYKAAISVLAKIDGQLQQRQQRSRRR